MEVVKRNRPGTKSADMWQWEKEEFSKKKGPFAIQEYIQENIRADPSDIKKILDAPKEAELPSWLYEHMRQFTIELNYLIVQLQESCTPISCSQMKATEDWLFLCACHGQQPRECSAIDYMAHTLEHAINLLLNHKSFQSRSSIPTSAIGQFPSISRRLYRFFLHTYHHHRDLFFEFEKENFLCARFTEFALKYEMIEPKFITIPQHAYAIKN